ncbi:hypothetical protein HY990_07455 [Candidatus Micrarchaeota archaeon]|nr:hypothetical protein [Candidatus Micrarchaeota archaeon]
MVGGVFAQNRTAQIAAQNVVANTNENTVEQVSRLMDRNTRMDTLTVDQALRFLASSTRVLGATASDRRQWTLSENYLLLDGAYQAYRAQNQGASLEDFVTALHRRRSELVNELYNRYHNGTLQMTQQIQTPGGAGTTNTTTVGAQIQAPIAVIDDFLNRSTAPGFADYAQLYNLRNVAQLRIASTGMDAILRPGQTPVERPAGTRRNAGASEQIAIAGPSIPPFTTVRPISTSGDQVEVRLGNFQAPGPLVVAFNNSQQNTDEYANAVQELQALLARRSGVTDADRRTAATRLLNALSDGRVSIPAEIPGAMRGQFIPNPDYQALQAIRNELRMIAEGRGGELANVERQLRQVSDLNLVYDALRDTVLITVNQRAMMAFSGGLTFVINLEGTNRFRDLTTGAISFDEAHWGLLNVALSGVGEFLRANATVDRTYFEVQQNADGTRGITQRRATSMAELQGYLLGGGLSATIGGPAPIGGNPITIEVDATWLARSSSFTTQGPIATRANMPQDQQRREVSFGEDARLEIYRVTVNNVGFEPHRDQRTGQMVRRDSGLRWEGATFEMQVEQRTDQNGNTIRTSNPLFELRFASRPVDRNNLRCMITYGLGVQQLLGDWRLIGDMGLNLAGRINQRGHSLTAGISGRGEFNLDNADAGQTLSARLSLGYATPDGSGLTASVGWTQPVNQSGQYITPAGPTFGVNAVVTTDLFRRARPQAVQFSDTVETNLTGLTDLYRSTDLTQLQRAAGSLVQTLRTDTTLDGIRNSQYGDEVDAAVRELEQVGHLSDITQIRAHIRAALRELRGVPAFRTRLPIRTGEFGGSQ